MPDGVRDADRAALRHAQERESLEPQRVDDRLQITDPCIEGKVRDLPVRQTAPRSSYRTYRWNLESSSIQCRHTGLSKSNWTWLSQFAAFTRGGPSPVVAQAIRTPSSEEQKRICCSIQASRGDKGMILGAKKVRGADSLK